MPAVFEMNAFHFYIVVCGSPSGEPNPSRFRWRSAAVLQASSVTNRVFAVTDEPSGLRHRRFVSARDCYVFIIVWSAEWRTKSQSMLLAVG